VAADAAAVGANVLVVDPAAQGPFAMRQILRQFLRGWPRSCPGVFSERLG
jgi:hypothetical protein